MANREFELAISEEVATFSGATVTFDMGAKPPLAKLLYDGLIKKVSFSGTPSDRFALKKALADIRRALRMMGAERAKPESTDEDEATVEKIYHKPNDGAARRLTLVSSDLAEVELTIDKKIEAIGVIPPGAMVFENTAEVRQLFTGADNAEESIRAALQARVDSIVDGIYFGLPDTIYHAVPALGSGSINDLIISPATFWRGSWLDPDRPELDEEQTAAQLIGKAYHCALLEPEEFEKRFVREPSKDDFPRRGMLTSDTAVKAMLKEMGAQQTVSGETNEERAERLENLGYEGTIWPLEYARWEREAGSREPVPTKIKADTWDDIRIDMERFQKSEVSELVDGGAAEVSVFWTDEHGLRCKARFDKLLSTHWCDLKTFQNSQGKNLEQALIDAVRWNRYYIQAAHYRDAAEAIRKGLVHVIGDATDAEREMIEEIQLRPAELVCWYVFQEKGGIPNLLARRFKFNAISDPSREHEMRTMADGDPAELARLDDAFGRKTKIHRRARQEIEQAKKLFVLYSQTYPTGDPWSPIDPMGTIDDADFSDYWLDNQ